MLQIKSLSSYQETYKKSVADPESFWEEIAGYYTWKKPWDQVLSTKSCEPKMKWFLNAKLNISENCLDRHLVDKGDQVALIWEANNPGDKGRQFTYHELHQEVCKTANALKRLGIEKGDRVCFYMPMVPELAIGLLACARIGAIHSVVFAGFSAQALADRIKDASCKLVICSDYNIRGKKSIPVKKVVDEALAMNCDSVKSVIVHKNSGGDIDWEPSRDVWWHYLIDDQSTVCEAEAMDAEDPLFILYTSGSTGKPKGVVHTCGGYMVYAGYSFKNVFQYEPGDVYWCTADIGWITGHTYIVYGPLLNGAITMMFEGVPTFPDAGRFWSICDKHKVNQFYTAPTAIRALMARGDEFVDKYDLSSLKVIGSVGEPINEEAWNWYNEKVGKGNAPVIDTWWQTETGGIMITPLPGITDNKPTYASYPLPGVQLCLVDKEGNEIQENGVEGLLCIKHPWPSMIRTTWGDDERCWQVYFNPFKGKYFTGDGARRDEEGRYRIIGRVDDVINVSGHRMGTAEVENAINEHPAIIESAVVGFPHEIKGQGIYAYVITDDSITSEDEFISAVREVVTKEIGPIAKPDQIQIVSGLPKTRSGKIMRRILRKIAAKEVDSIGDVSTLLNPDVVEEIKKGAKV